jgi:hypothetical protein
VLVTVPRRPIAVAMNPDPADGAKAWTRATLPTATEIPSVLSSIAEVFLQAQQEEFEAEEDRLAIEACDAVEMAAAAEAAAALADTTSPRRSRSRSRSRDGARASRSPSRARSTA